MDRSSLATFLISGSSLAVSVFVLWRQYQAAGRAHFTAEWEASDSLVYINHGPGAARDVQVHLTSLADISQDVPYIGALQRMRIWVVRAMGAEPPRCLELSWRDNRRRRQTLQVFLPEPPSSSRRTHVPRDALEKAVRQIARDEAEQEIDYFARHQR